MTIRKANLKKAKQEVQEIIAAHYIKEPPVDAASIARDMGIEIEYIDLEDKNNSNIASYLKITEKNKIIYVNEAFSFNMQNFTIAKQIGRLVLHKKHLKKISNIAILIRDKVGTYKSNPLEKEANFFAANLLVPDEILKRFIFMDIHSLEDFFRTPREVIRFRLWEFDNK